MQFEWDEEKNHINIKKHSIDFITASEVFNDPNRIISFNWVASGEIRLQVIGKIEKILIIMLVYTERNGKNRIISARPANKMERFVYEQND